MVVLDAKHSRLKSSICRYIKYGYETLLYTIEIFRTNYKATFSHRTSHIAHRTWHIAHRTSHIAHRTSYIAHRTSHITHRTSHIARASQEPPKSRQDGPMTQPQVFIMFHEQSLGCQK